MRRLAPWVVTLFLVAACCTGQSPYPFPPQFVSEREVPPTTLPQPPQPHSARYEAEIRTIVARQAKLTDAQKKTIWKQNTILPEVIVQPVLGNNITPENFPKLYSFLRHVASDAWRIGDEARVYWKSPRPWYADKRVGLFVPVINTYGYPSGHTATFGTWAWVLSDMVPQKRAQFFTTAYGVADNRILGGAHFPHDIEGGKQIAIVIYEQMRANPTYQKEFAAAKAELRRGLARTQ